MKWNNKQYPKKYSTQIAYDVHMIDDSFDF